MKVYFLISLLLSLIYFNDMYIANAKRKSSSYNQRANNNNFRRFSFDGEDNTERDSKQITIITPKVLPFWSFFNRRPIIKRPAIRVIIANIVSQLIAFKHSIVNAIFAKFRPPSNNVSLSVQFNKNTQPASVLMAAPVNIIPVTPDPSTTTTTTPFITTTTTSTTTDPETDWCKHNNRQHKKLYIHKTYSVHHHFHTTPYGI